MRKKKHKPINIKNIKDNRFIPETNIRLNQRDSIKNVCPISGCKNSKRIIGMIAIRLKRYLTYLLEYFSDVSIIDNMIIKNGLSISIGWNLGKKNISIHLLEPLTSTPIIGTKIKVQNIITKENNDSL